jgi:hypothetical protein
MLLLLTLPFTEEEKKKVGKTGEKENLETTQKFTFCLALAGL